MTSSQPINFRNHQSTPLSTMTAVGTAQSSAANSPQLVTPASTPPSASNPPAIHGFSSFFEARLAHLLSNCEAGTHSFPRDPEDMGLGSHAQIGQKVQNAGDHTLTPPPRRPSFLSSLSLSRPFAFTPSTSSTQIPTQPHMESHQPQNTEQSTVPPQHTSSAPSGPISAPPKDLRRKSEPAPVLPTTMQRSKTAVAAVVEERRHFNPSREPKLLGLL